MLRLTLRVLSVFPRVMPVLLVMPLFCCPILVAGEKATSGVPSVASSSSSSTDSEQWLKEFRQTYALPDGKVLKHIPRPFTPGRLEYYRVHHSLQAKSAPGGPTAFMFRWDKPPKGINQSREGRISGGGMIFTGQGGYSISHLIDTFIDVNPFDIEGDAKPKFTINSLEVEGDAKIKFTAIPGDWVLRDGADLQQVLKELETILREECRLPVKLSLVEKDRKVIVVKGKYAYRPMSGRQTVTEDHVFGYEGSYLQDYDQLDIFEQEKDRKGIKDSRSGHLSKFLSWLQWNVDRPVIDGGVVLPKDMLPPNTPKRLVNQSDSDRPHLLEWQYDRLAIREARRRGTLDVAAVLKNLGKQTGLEFVEETRRRRTVVIDLVE